MCTPSIHVQQCNGSHCCTIAPVSEGYHPHPFVTSVTPSPPSRAEVFIFFLCFDTPRIRYRSRVGLGVSDRPAPVKGALCHEFFHQACKWLSHLLSLRTGHSDCACSHAGGPGFESLRAHHVSGDRCRSACDDRSAKSSTSRLIETHESAARWNHEELSFAG